LREEQLRREKIEELKLIRGIEFVKEAFAKEVCDYIFMYDSTLLVLEFFIEKLLACLPPEDRLA